MIGYTCDTTRRDAWKGDGAARSWRGTPLQHRHDHRL